MREKVRWGVLGVAKIAATKVIPAMQKGEWSEITAIASRDIGKARGAAERLGVGKAYGSYEELLADPDVEAVYNPLPNHLHVPWSTRAAPREEARVVRKAGCDERGGMPQPDACARRNRRENW